MKKNKFHVLNSKFTIFACGGETDGRNPDVNSSLSYRDKFLTYTATDEKNEVIHSAIVMAELFKDYRTAGGYKNLLEFEDDIASLSTVVLIFLESAGSLVELGLYCSRTAYLHKLIIVADESYGGTDSDSFIALGPLEHIKSYEKSSVLIHEFPNYKNNYQSDVEDLVDDIFGRFTDKPVKEKFKNEDQRHLALIIAEVIRLTHPILISELEECLILLDVDIKTHRLKQLVYVLEKMRFILHINKSDNVYYFPVDPSSRLATFGKKENGASFDDGQLLINLRMIEPKSTMERRRKLAMTKYMGKDNNE